ncbi:AraC family transcriptional regulator [Fulvivirgaceae bacterium BMA10]|uniref:AraC family transcriptional regulator n=1 Tax=Splendidivirga corallicola TaxID=3051826 RepID=A0ABT8KJ18_9BACT|nr:AraC family transcriptional regulator [Fulvivirgaceae bacterium BMA10]
MKKEIGLQHTYLDPAIGSFWYAEQEHIDVNSATIPFLNHEVILNFGDIFSVNDSNGSNKVILSEIGVRPMKTYAHGKYNAMGVLFGPAGIYRIFGMSVEDFVSLKLTPREIFRDGYEELLQRLDDSNSPDAKLKTFWNFILSNAAKRKVPEIVEDIIEFVSKYHNEPVQIAKILDTLGTSSKHLICTFKKVVGVTPKKYIQLVQLNKSLKQIRKQPDKRLTEIALENGFYDQSHFIRVFKKFSGLSPKEYRAKCLTHGKIPDSFINTIYC